MSTGTNKERLTQNNEIITDNNADLTALKTKINNLPTSGDTTATANDIALGKTAVSKGVKITGTYTPPTVSLQSKDVTINQNGTTTITADTGYDGMSDVDVTVEGVLDTSDATATAGDIADGKTAYVNNQKIQGNLPTVYSGGSVQAGGVDISGNTIKFSCPGNYLIKQYGSLFKTKSDFTALVGLTADKLKKDEVVLGVTGTYEGTKAVLPDGIRFQNSRASNMDFLNNVDSSNVTDTLYMFNGCTNLTTIPLLNTSNVTGMGSMFNGCTNLTTIPLLNTSNVTGSMGSMFNGCTKLTTIPQLDTSNVTVMGYMFYRCTNLTTIPLLNTSNVTDMQNMFGDCSNLSNESLNNILAMCANTTSAYTRTKTLKEIGLSQTQATTCQTLSNWDAFVAAGWSTGYTS